MGVSTAILVAVLLAVLACLGAFFALLVNVMQRTARRDAEEAVTALRDQVLKLLDRAEALKARHARLLGSGQAGVPPPAGATERAHAEAKASIQELLDGWTALQQRLERARALVEEEGKWGRRLLDEARDLSLDKENEPIAARAAAAADEAQRLLDGIEDAPRRALAAAERAKEAARRAGRLERVEAKVVEIEARLRTDPVAAADDAEALARDAGAAPR